MWNKKLSRCIKKLELEVDWCIAIELSMDETEFVLFNIYMPYQTPENDDRYLE